MASEQKAAPFVMQRAQPKAGPGIDPDKVKPEARQVRAKRSEGEAAAPATLTATSADAKSLGRQQMSDPTASASRRGEPSEHYKYVLRDLYERVAKLQVAIAAIEALQ